MGRLSRVRAGDYLAALDRMPFASVEQMTGPGGIVVLAPHPDDETLGCGGLIASAHGVGRHVEIVILTDGSGSHPQSRSHPPERLAAVRKNEVRRAVAALGLTEGRLTFLDRRDAAAPHTGPEFDRVVGELEALISRVGADTLFVTWEHDPHCDHEAAASIASAVARRRPGLRVWRYPIWGLRLPVDAEIDAAPPRGVRLDIRPWLNAKRAALECHASQLGRLIHDDPAGFHLTAETLEVLVSPVERFIGDDA